ncbi:uncharacterized protein CXorf49 homolog isoform X2 [Erinaceus europaeus]|uniref:Uncharacterized protein CXorf49 homolog isoform X2 n=1 Tax=Erinaceus europaeus TaxID=9365 RepID=A0ABM3WW73_ERIEU|nr:uncharacterized protein CXorf49 homolog isoform X2 [Erinaceus europaeus]XP_060040816.1 uncharacterized protein CXorf49 homolog isoform X2 [Erinaceus europaeus]
MWGRARGRPSYPVASTVTGLPQPSPRRKVAQEKKALGVPSKMALGRIFPSWGQRVSAAPPEPATFPPISGVPLLGRSKRFTLVPSGSKQSKHHTAGAGKKSTTRRSREPEPGPGDNRDPSLKGQFLMYRAGPLCHSLHRGEFNSGSFNSRIPQAPGISQPLTPPSQEDFMPRESSGDQEPLDHPTGPERQHQQSPGAQGCPQPSWSP